MSSVAGQAALTGATSYTYDAKNQLTQEASTRAGGFTNSYAYDAVGNPTTFKGQTRTYNAKNQLTGGTGLAGAFTYDNDGNPTSYNGATVTYNVNDCLTAFGTALTAGYDSGGLRVWKQNTATGQRTYFLYEGGVPVCELDASGNVIATNTWGPSGLVSRRVGSSSVFYTFDERGNTVQRTNSTGTVLSSRINDAYGTPGGSASTGDPYDGFGGQYGYYTDTETGLQLCTFRYYDPNTGRWINRDPIGYKDGPNIYAYVKGNPVMGVDPSGLNENGGQVRNRTGRLQWAVGTAPGRMMRWLPGDPSLFDVGIYEMPTDVYVNDKGERIPAWNVPDSDYYMFAVRPDQILGGGSLDIDGGWDRHSKHWNKNGGPWAGGFNTYSMPLIGSWDDFVGAPYDLRKGAIPITDTLSPDSIIASCRQR